VFERWNTVRQTFKYKYQMQYLKFCVSGSTV